jgi:Fe2+ or Zn2+ uptake regulation protein
LVRELRLGERHHHYEYGAGEGRLPDHAHIVCRACTKVVEFASPGLEHLQRDLRERFGFHAQGADLEIAALCDDCLAAAGDAAVPAAS